MRTFTWFFFNPVDLPLLDLLPPGCLDAGTNALEVSPHAGEEAARRDQGGVPRHGTHLQDRSPREPQLHELPRRGDQGDIQDVPINSHPGP